MQVQDNPEAVSAAERDLPLKLVEALLQPDVRLLIIHEPVIPERDPDRVDSQRSQEADVLVAHHAPAELPEKGVRALTAIYLRECFPNHLIRSGHADHEVLQVHHGAKGISAQAHRLPVKHEAGAAHLDEVLAHTVPQFFSPEKATPSTI